MPLVPTLPSPVSRWSNIRGAGGELWVKDDGLLHPIYGGNKIRKLALLLSDARRRGNDRVLTCGAAGSHHVLTTALFAREYGLRVAAVLGPQPATPHVEEVLRATVAQDVELLPVRSLSGVPLAMIRAQRPGDYWIGPGGTGVLSSSAYSDAVRELKQQVDAGEMPEPDTIVVALGSGGTAAGILAGVLACGLKSRVVAVQVVSGVGLSLMVLGLARWVLAGEGTSIRALASRLVIDRQQLGKGYGWPTPTAERAQAISAEAGIPTELTYTAKALASALALVAEGGPRNRVVLYWHTLSRTSAADVPPPHSANEPLSPELRQLLRPR